MPTECIANKRLPIHQSDEGFRVVATSQSRQSTHGATGIIMSEYMHVELSALVRARPNTPITPPTT